MNEIDELKHITTPSQIRKTEKPDMVGPLIAFILFIAIGFYVKLEINSILWSSIISFFGKHTLYLFFTIVILNLTKKSSLSRISLIFVML